MIRFILQPSSGFIDCISTNDTYLPLTIGNSNSALNLGGSVINMNAKAYFGTTVGVPTTETNGGTGDRIILYPGSATTHPYWWGYFMAFSSFTRKNKFI